MRRVVTCSCDPNHHNYIAALQPTVQQLHSDVVIQEECQHVIGGTPRHRQPRVPWVTILSTTDSPPQSGALIDTIVLRQPLKLPVVQVSNQQSVKRLEF